MDAALSEGQSTILRALVGVQIAQPKAVPGTWIRANFSTTEQDIPAAVSALMTANLIEGGRVHRSDDSYDVTLGGLLHHACGVRERVARVAERFAGFIGARARDLEFPTFTGQDLESAGVLGGEGIVFTWRVANLFFLASERSRTGDTNPAGYAWGPPPDPEWFIQKRSHRELIERRHAWDEKNRAAWQHAQKMSAEMGAPHRSWPHVPSGGAAPIVNYGEIVFGMKNQANVSDSTTGVIAVADQVANVAGHAHAALTPQTWKVFIADVRDALLDDRPHLDEVLREDIDRLLIAARHIRIDQATQEQQLTQMKATLDDLLAKFPVAPNRKLHAGLAVIKALGANAAGSYLAAELLRLLASP